jgi:hypothetical protein
MDSLDGDLGLDLAGLVPRSGRQSVPLTAEFVREIEVADLQMPATKIQTAPPIKKIRDSHHALARVLVTAGSEAEASAITGYSPSRISILKADPQFKELLEFYRQEGATAVADLRNRMAGMALDALQELQERLEEKPDDFGNVLLKDIVKEMADRTGHAPQRGPSAVTQVNIGLTDRIARARERVNQLTSPERVIEHE